MMMNLFSVFDPTSYFGLPINWLILLMIIIFIPSQYFLKKSMYSNMYGMMNNYLSKLFSEISFPNYSMFSFLCTMMFLYLIMSNLLGLFPFVFTSTAHPMVTLGLGVLLWISFFLMGWGKNMKNSIIHLVPQGSPLVLSPLMVLIESVSHLIRPFTLSIRLAANMMAGHLIIGLMSSISLITMWSMYSSLIFQSMLLILEFGIAIIQGFVFSILLLLYAMEYY